MFQGRFVHQIDVKGRVSVPAGIRMELQRRSQLAPVLTIRPDHLALFAHEDFRTFADRLMAIDPLNLQGQELARFFIAHSEACAPDSQGRILIPAHMREHAEIEKEVVVAGVGNWIEIWDRRRFEAGHQRTLARFSEISTEVSKLGH